MKKLNTQQQSAIKHNNGPMLIIAGAGTGKTTVITQRILHIVDTKKARPEEILALTFTEKASQEMEERVDVALPLGYNQMWISTFHSFCDRILRDSGLEIGLDTKYTLLTQAQAIKLIRDNIFKFEFDYFRPLGNPTKFVQGLLTHFSRLQDENILPEKYIKWTNNFKGEKMEKKRWKELANGYSFYTQLKNKNSYLDFGDLIVKSLQLFEKRKNILKEYQQKFKYILVDEFQDTNYAQNLLVIKLAGSKANLCVVGDDDQSIYKFRGASVSNIIQFRESFPDSKTVVLNKNYRSFQEILDLSYKVIQNNNPDRLEVKENIDKKLLAHRKGKAEIELIHAKSGLGEAEVVAKRIIKLCKSEYKFSDIAILVRANSQADIFTKTFERLNIPHQFLGPAKLFQQQEILDLISFLKVINDPHDDISLTRFLSIDEVGISGRQISDLSSMARAENISLFETLERQSKSNKEFEKIFEIINSNLQIKYKQLAGNILFEFLQQIGIYENLLNSDTEQGVVKANNISKFFEKIKQLENNNRSEGLVRDVVDWVDLSLDLGDSPQASEVDWTLENKVNILTIHSAKGLEFPVVFVANMVNLRFPSTNKKDQIPIPDELIKEKLPQKDHHLEEERRLFYVACTRARDKLFFTAADHYGDSVRAKKLSQFILESGIANQRIVETEYQAPLKDQKSNTTKKISIDKLSYSQIESFRICPLHYKLAYILKIATPDSASLSLGNSVHESMLDVFTEIKAGNKLKNIDFKEILDKNWINRGFMDKKHTLQAKKTALKYINNYFENQYKGEKPIALEEKFNINLGSNLKISGKIDRIDQLSDGKIEIIDYKTGSNVPSQKEVDNNLQLSIYALAAQEIYKKPALLSLYYFEENKKISTTRSKIQLKNAIKEIFEIKEKIEQSDFKCSGHYFCQSCEYSIFCKGEEK